MIHLFPQTPGDAGNCPLFKEGLEDYMQTAGTHYKTLAVSHLLSVSPLSAAQAHIWLHYTALQACQIDSRLMPPPMAAPHCRHVILMAPFRLNC